MLFKEWGLVQTQELLLAQGGMTPWKRLEEALRLAVYSELRLELCFVIVTSPKS